MTTCSCKSIGQLKCVLHRESAFQSRMLAGVTEIVQTYVSSLQVDHQDKPYLEAELIRMGLDYVDSAGRIPNHKLLDYFLKTIEREAFERRL